MEYNLLKTIEPNLRLQMNPSTHPRLSQYPATDFVNPGVGQIARLYSFNVPMHSNYSELTINKEVDTPVNQEGRGNDTVTSEDEIESEIESKDFDPIEYNNRKRKHLGEAVQSSFMHPKPVKTGILSLPLAQKMKKKDEIKTPSKKTKTERHKFQFF